jgi:hypothetical protein
VQAGATIGRRYALISEIDYDVPGVETWLARDTRLDRRVVVHVASSLAPSVVRQAAARASLVRDPRLARVLATGREGSGDSSRTYVVVERPQGVALDTVLARHRLPTPVAGAIVGELTTALAAATARGHHHGMIRPSAVTLSKRGRVTLSGFGLDGELATQAGIGRGRSERADAVALGRLYLAAVTGMDVDDVTEADIPDGLTDAAAKMCSQVVRGTGPRTLTSVARAMGAAPASVLVNFPVRVKTFPLRADVAAEERARKEEAERRAAEEAERIAREAAAALAAGERVDTSQLEALFDGDAAVDAADISIDPAVLDDAAREAADRDSIAHASAELIAEIEAELEDAGAPPLTEEEIVNLRDLYTFDYMVAEQNAGPAPSVWEALLERLHERHPSSETLTRRLEAARVRAQRPAPFNVGPLIMALSVVAVVVLAIVAFSLVRQPIHPDFDLQNNPDNTYPEFTFTPPASLSPDDA